MSNKTHLSVKVTEEQKEWLDQRDKPNSEFVRDLLRAARRGNVNDEHVAALEMHRQREQDRVDEYEMKARNARQRLEKVDELYDTPEDRRNQEVQEWAETLYELNGQVTNRDHPRLTELAESHFDGDVEATADAVNDVVLSELEADEPVVILL